MTDALLRATGIKKTFIRDQQRLQILHGLDFEIKQGESVAIVGGSGTGKSTLLQILGTLDSPTEGEVFFKGQNVTHWSDHKLAEFRNQNLGFVFQFHHLLHEFTALENVMFPCLIQKMPSSLAKEKAAYVLAELGLKDRLDHFPSQLSGGELYSKSLAGGTAKVGFQADINDIKVGTENKFQTAKNAFYNRVKLLATEEITEINQILQKMHIVEAEILQQVTVSQDIAATDKKEFDVKKGSTGSNSRNVLKFPATEEV